jgi:hypothetical protein
MHGVLAAGAQVDILVVNCSLFNPTPSLSAMLVNHFKMKSNVVSYNLSGMGCSAGVIAVSLAKELLQARARPPLLHPGFILMHCRLAGQGAAAGARAPTPAAHSVDCGMKG